jgi:hypothetical protein
MTDLAQRDFVEQPVRAAAIGNMLGTVSEHNAAIDAAAIPMLAACEAVENVGGQFFGLLAHGGFPFLLAWLRGSARLNLCPSARPG